jgi:hypothetical protein
LKQESIITEEWGPGSLENDRGAVKCCLKKTWRLKMGIFEFLMLCCFGFSWPFSIAKSLKSRSAKGKSLGFMLLVEVGYVFGIIHKVLYSYNWVIWAYVSLFLLVGVDIALYFRNAALDRQRDAM